MNSSTANPEGWNSRIRSDHPNDRNQDMGETKDSRTASNRKSNVFDLVQENISSFFTESTPGSSKGLDSEGKHILERSATMNFSTKQVPSVTQGDHSSTPNLQTNFMMDKIIEKFISMALPSTIEESSNFRIRKRLKEMEPRPSLSVQVMSKNFIQLNARLSAPFELINEILNFFKWKNPNLTVSWLLILSNLIIRPSYLIMMGLITLILIPMSNSFYEIYEPLPGFMSNLIPEAGLSDYPIRNPKFIKPPNEFTREFLINVTDLQNHMLIYIYIWDLIALKITNRFGNFSNELISSALFLAVLVWALSIYLFCELYKSLLPVAKVGLIISIWLLAIAFHPRLKVKILNVLLSEELRIKLLNTTNDLEKIVNSGFVFDQLPKEHTFEVEIFETQMLDEESSEWNHSFFTDDPLTRKSLPRFSCSISAVDNISKIQAPANFEFVSNSIWKIDLNSPEIWLKGHLIDPHSTQFDVETKWVYDLDLDEEENGSTKYRRRRWLRNVNVCNSEEETTNDSLNSTTFKSENKVLIQQTLANT